jgi:hypothetical protein
MRSEPHRHLNLDRTVDREHLATDLAESERIARRSSAQPEPTASGGTDEPAVHADAESCHAGLIRQIMTTHDVSAAQVLAATSRAPG